MIKQIDHYTFSRTNDHPLPYQMTNFLIHTLNYNVYIDSGLGTKALEELSLYAQSDKENVLILSHHDYDHVWGSGALNFKSIYGHISINQRILADTEQILVNQKYQEGSIQIILADQLISKDTEIDDLVILVSPGHTSDSLAVYDQRTKNLFIADNIGDQGCDLVPELEDRIAYKETLIKLMDYPIMAIYGSHRNMENASILDIIMKSLT